MRNCAKLSGHSSTSSAGEAPLTSQGPIATAETPTLPRRNETAALNLGPPCLSHEAPFLDTFPTPHTQTHTHVMNFITGKNYTSISHFL